MNEICIEYKAMFNYVLTVPGRLFQGTLGISVLKFFVLMLALFPVAGWIILLMLLDILRELFSPMIDGHWTSGRYRLNHILMTLMAVGIAVIKSGFWIEQYHQCCRMFLTCHLYIVSNMSLIYVFFENCFWQE